MLERDPAVYIDRHTLGQLLMAAHSMLASN